MEQRWKRIAVPPANVKSYLADASRDDGMFGRYVDTVGANSSSNPAFSSDYGRKKDIDQLMMKLNVAHLQIPGQKDIAKEILQRMIRIGSDYLLGGWRNHAECENGQYNWQQCRSELSWFDEFRMTMLAATVLGDWDSIKEVARFVDDDLPYDEGAWDFYREDNLAYICLGKVLAGGMIDQNDESVVRIDTSRRKRAKLVLRGILALADNSAREVFVIVNALVKSFARTPHRCEGLMISSWEASILYNLAQMKQMDIGTIAQANADYLTTNAVLSENAADQKS